MYVDDHHREVAWQRWISKVRGADTDGVKTKLRRIANALTAEDVDRSLSEFESSQSFTSSSRLSNWFTNTWKPHLMASLSHCTCLFVSCFTINNSVTCVLGWVASTDTGVIDYTPI